MSSKAHNVIGVITLGACLSTTAPVLATQKQLLWGDTHLHTSYSADSYLYGNFTVDPDTAYRFARGQPVAHPLHGARVQLETPLDFLVVSDHAEFLGGIRQLHTGSVDTTGLGPIDRLILWLAKRVFAWALSDGYGMDLFDSFSATAMDPREGAAKLAAETMYTLPGQQRMVATAWRETAEIADAHNRPGEFSAIIGWEWTSTPGGANLHRVIFTDGDARTATTYIPFSRDDSPYPEDLWHFLEATSTATGDRFVSIPHNSNISKGFMFPLETLRGEAFTPEYLRLRAKWEPVVEATQIKGDSETHPLISTRDEFADFERYSFYIQATPEPYQPREGDFVRSALGRGLQIERAHGINPYRFGVIGSTDSHTGLSSPQEDRFFGEQPQESIPGSKARDKGEAQKRTGWDVSASGLAAVWAEDNTREAILDAFLRREVYATTGPRIVVRFDGGWFARTGADPAGSLPHPEVTVSTEQSLVPMGSILPQPARADLVPGFSVSAMKDPGGANLDRIQVVKGWVDAQGESREEVFDVAWSPGRTPDANGVLPPVGNTVDIASASYENSIGAATLQATWLDPAFEPAQRAFYYARVLEIPTPRHSLYDAVALGIEPPARWPATLQERAYTSAIWYQPPGEP